MKFLHVNHRYYPFVGGSERYMQEVSEYFSAAAHDVHVVTSDAFDLEYFWDRRRRNIDAPPWELIGGVSVRRVPISHLPLNPLLFQGSRRLLGEMSRLRMPPARIGAAVSRRLPRMPQLSAVLEESGPTDLLHAANVGLEGPAVVARDVARKWDVPFIMTPFLHLGREGDRVARRYVTMPHQKSLLRSADHVVAMTKLEASFLILNGIDPDRISVTGVGVDVAEVTGGNGDNFRAKYNIQGALVGVASAVAFDKGSHLLVQAIASLRSQGHNVELVLAGPRLEQFNRWFDQLDERSKVGIHLPGFIAESEKRDMLAALDVLAMPSRTESFGIAYLEGWANGKPVVAARAGAVPEIVIDGQNGLLVEFDDVTRLAAAILELLLDGNRARRLGESGQRMTLDRYTWPDVLQRVRQAYSSALGVSLEGP